MLITSLQTGRTQRVTVERETELSIWVVRESSGRGCRTVIKFDKKSNRSPDDPTIVLSAQ